MRSKILIILFVVFLTVIFSQGKIQIKFMVPFTGNDFHKIQSYCVEFEKQNPQVQIAVNGFDKSTTYQILYLNASDNTLPDIFVYHISRLEYVKSYLLNLKPYFKNSYLKNFWKKQKNILFSTNNVYGIPLDIHPVVMFYNKNFIQSPPKNIKDFFNILETYKQNKGKAFAFSYMFPVWFSIYAQFNGKGIFDKAAFVKSLEFFNSLVNKKKLVPAPKYFDTYKMIGEKKIGLVFDGVWQRGWLCNDLSYEMATIPQLGNRKAEWCDSHVFGISKTVDSKKIVYLTKLIRFINSKEDWGKLGLLPARLDTMKKIVQKDDFAKILYQNLDTYFYTPRTDYNIEWYYIINLTISKVLDYNMDVAQAVQEAEDYLRSIGAL